MLVPFLGFCIGSFTYQLGYQFTNISSTVGKCHRLTSPTLCSFIWVHTVVVCYIEWLCERELLLGLSSKITDSKRHDQRWTIMLIDLTSFGQGHIERAGLIVDCGSNHLVHTIFIEGNVPYTVLVGSWVVRTSSRQHFFHVKLPIVVVAIGEIVRTNLTYPTFLGDTLPNATFETSRRANHHERT